MPNGLFIRSYPAPGVRIVPASYRGAKGGYALVAAITILFVLVAIPAHWAKSSWSAALGLVTCLMVVSALMIFFRSFRLDVRAEGIAYANAWRGERFIAFEEMSTVVLITNQWVADAAAHRPSFTMPGTIIITAKPDTGKPILKIPLWLFSDPAESQVTHLLRPEEWAVDS